MGPNQAVCRALNRRVSTTAPDKRQRVGDRREQNRADRSSAYRKVTPAKAQKACRQNNAWRHVNSAGGLEAHLINKPVA